MNPVEKLFQAVIEEANFLKEDMISFVWYDDFEFDDCKWELSQYLLRHTKCIYLGHGYTFIPDIANKPFFVEVANKGAYIYSVGAMKGNLEDEQAFVERLVDAIEQAYEFR